MNYRFLANQFSINKGLTAIEVFLLLLIILPLFIPFAPKMPAQSVDPSWALGLNQAVAQGLAFGKEIIFTLGPYSCIYTKFYHPATDSMMLWGSMYLACTYSLALFFLMDKASWGWRLAFGGFLLTFVYAKDALFFSYPLLLALVLFHHLLKEKNLTTYELILFIILFSPLGLLSLIKGSLLILCGSSTILCALILLHYQRYFFSCCVLLTPLISLTLFWILAGQNLVNIVPYIVTSFDLAFSFTEAMSFQGNSFEIITYLSISALIIFLISKQKLPKILVLFLISIFFLFLFLSFKAGFTRHFGHAFIAGTSLLIAALLLPYCVRSKALVPVVFLAFIVSFYIEGHYRTINLFKNIQSTYSTAAYGIVNRITDSNWLNNNFLFIMNFLKTNNNLPVLKGRSDVYSYEQTDLIASGNQWSPRPIFQSYSVFNTALAQKNRHHLEEQTPENIFLKLQPIDNRWPSLEEGSSWPIFLQNYRISAWANGYLVLLKTNSIFISPKQIKQKKCYLGENIKVPYFNLENLIFVKIELEPTYLGRVVKILFKLPELKITAKLNNGIEKQFRFIPSMAKSIFLLSPLIETTQEFAQLYQNEIILRNKQVSSFKIEAVNNNNFFSLWQSAYTVHFKIM